MGGGRPGGTRELYGSAAYKALSLLLFRNHKTPHNCHGGGGGGGGKNHNNNGAAVVRAGRTPRRIRLRGRGLRDPPGLRHPRSGAGRRGRPLAFILGAPELLRGRRWGGGPGAASVNAARGGKPQRVVNFMGNKISKPPESINAWEGNSSGGCGGLRGGGGSASHFPPFRSPFAPGPRTPPPRPHSGGPAAPAASSRRRSRWSRGWDARCRVGAGGN